MLFDTDVLIWVLRGNEEAARAVHEAPERRISIVSYMELVQGARDRAELRQIQAFLSDCSVRIVPLSENIGHRASIYVEEYGLSMAMGLADALIAATAVESRLALCTGNRKHYKPIRDLQLKPFRAR